MIYVLIEIEGKKTWFVELGDVLGFFNTFRRRIKSIEIYEADPQLILILSRNPALNSLTTFPNFPEIWRRLTQIPLKLQDSQEIQEVLQYLSGLLKRSSRIAEKAHFYAFSGDPDIHFKYQFR